MQGVPLVEVGPALVAEEGRDAGAGTRAGLHHQGEKSRLTSWQNRDKSVPEMLVSLECVLVSNIV